MRRAYRRRTPKVNRETPAQRTTPPARRPTEGLGPAIPAALAMIEVKVGACVSAACADARRLRGPACGPRVAWPQPGAATGTGVGAFAQHSSRRGAADAHRAPWAQSGRGHNLGVDEPFRRREDTIRRLISEHAMSEQLATEQSIPRGTSVGQAHGKPLSSMPTELADGLAPEKDQR
jgi:hypothetical protein